METNNASAPQDQVKHHARLPNRATRRANERTVRRMEPGIIAFWEKHLRRPEDVEGRHLGTCSKQTTAQRPSSKARPRRIHSAARPRCIRSRARTGTKTAIRTASASSDSGGGSSDGGGGSSDGGSGGDGSGDGPPIALKVPPPGFDLRAQELALKNEILTCAKRVLIYAEAGLPEAGDPVALRHFIETFEREPLFADSAEPKGSC